MAIPDIHPTGLDYVDYNLALMIKWRENGASMGMLIGEAYRAAREMVELLGKGLATPEQAEQFCSFVDAELRTYL